MIPRSTSCYAATAICPSRDTCATNLAKKWNGKPVLLAASAGFGGRERPGISRFIRGADCLEVNVDVSESFTYIARGAIYLVTDKLRDIRIKFGFVVEGRERDELCRNQGLRRLLDGVATTHRLISTQATSCPRP